jgi:hypothetical protein
MNEKGHKATLVARQTENTNAVKYGVHSERLIRARASEIEAELITSFDFSPLQRLAVHEVAHHMAILEAIDRDLDERGLFDKRGELRYLLNRRERTSRQLERWLEKISNEIERQAAIDEAPRAETEDFVRELQRIALGKDPRARTQDQLVAIRQLLKMGVEGTTTYLETPPGERRDLKLRKLME